MGRRHFSILARFIHLSSEISNMPSWLLLWDFLANSWGYKPPTLLGALAAVCAEQGCRERWGLRQGFSCLAVTPACRLRAKWIRSISPARPRPDPSRATISLPAQLLWRSPCLVTGGGHRRKSMGTTFWSQAVLCDAGQIPHLL